MRRHTLNLGERYMYCEGDVPLLFTENETNNQRIFGTPNPSPYVKDGINDYVVDGKQDAVNPQNTRTKLPPTIRSMWARKNGHYPSAAQ